ncbi:MAG: ankyrin repeat domain-containing protein [Puniceicoccales bacterium]|jgi:ankyrin repeat protein|nr:ankyrin repeat domain-containing protein [Puniceicoccales bacterium]
MSTILAEHETEHSNPKAQDNSCTSNVVTETCTEKSPLPNKLKIRKLSESSSKLRNAWNRCLYMLMHYACQKNSEEYRAIETLFGQHPDIIYLVDNDGRNLLMHATLWNKEDIFTFLLPYYINAESLDVQDSYGYTALFIAIQKKNKYITASLLVYGARTDICNREGFNPLQFSCTLENLEMFYFMKSIFEKLHELKELMAQKGSDLTKTVYN